jgi:hypothetical protein
VIRKSLRKTDEPIISRGTLHHVIVISTFFFGAVKRPAHGDPVSFLKRLGLNYVPFMHLIFQMVALLLDGLLLPFAVVVSYFELHKGRGRYERALNRSETYAALTEEMVYVN